MTATAQRSATRSSRRSSPGNVEEEAGQSCASEVEDNLPEDDYELTIDTLQVEGDTATVGVTDQDDNESVLHFERTDADWRIARVTPGS